MGGGSNGPGSWHTGRHMRYASSVETPGMGTLVVTHTPGTEVSIPTNPNVCNTTGLSTHEPVQSNDEHNDVMSIPDVSHVIFMLY